MFGSKQKVDPNSFEELVKKRDQILKDVESTFGIGSISLSFRDDSRLNRLVEKIKNPSEESTNSALRTLNLATSPENINKLISIGKKYK